MAKNRRSMALTSPAGAALKQSFRVDLKLSLTPTGSKLGCAKFKAAASPVRVHLECLDRALDPETGALIRPTLVSLQYMDRVVSVARPLTTQMLKKQ